jgi:glycosyltransferase involved in cell wall biosynthesis
VARILFLPDDVTGNYSGSFSAKATIQQLKILGHQIGVIDRAVADPFINDDGVHFFVPPTALRWWEHFVSPELLGWFEALCDDFRPDYFIMAGGIQKPAILAKAARKRGIRTVFLFYMNDFYCHKIYAGLADGPCVACAQTPEVPAIRNGCIVPTRAANFVKGAIVRAAVQNEMRRAYRVLGYSPAQNEIYRQIGIKDAAIRQIAFQFDPTELDAVVTRDEGYLAVTGQPILQKGVHLIAGIVDRLPASVRIRISIMDPLMAQRLVDRLGWLRLIKDGRLEIVTDLRSRKDYLDFIASCRGLILPTYYPTTGEFVLQEALYLGKPVIAFDVGAHRDVLHDGENAMIAAVGDLETFARKTEMIYNDRELREKIAMGARQSSRAFYGSEAIALWSEVLT